MLGNIARRILPTVFFGTLVALLVQWTVPPSATAGGHDVDAEFLSLVNHERAARGLGQLVEAPDLVIVARRHSAAMASRGEVGHNPRLAAEVGGWEMLGETVGVGAGERQIHENFMASNVHRDVILDPRFTQVGVGTVIVGSEIWVTEVFRQPAAGSAPPPEAPPGPPPAASREPATEAAPEPQTANRDRSEPASVSAPAPPPLPAPAAAPRAATAHAPPKLAAALPPPAAATPPNFASPADAASPP
ncbi:MAG: CAP domain-containing protein, partial [Acidimicrobiales bacterium]